MPLYISDPEVSKLADHLCKVTGVSKTEMVRRLLREEAQRIERSRTAEARARALNEISREGAKLAAKVSGRFTYTKQDADEMFRYIETSADRHSRNTQRNRH